MPNRLLVLDDESLIAWGMADEMEFLGWKVPHVVGTREQALEAVAEGDIDAAILDFNLRGETSEDVARRLIELGLPFLFVSGAIPESFPSFGHPIELVTKPIDYRRVSDLLTAMLPGPGTADDEQPPHPLTPPSRQTRFALGAARSERPDVAPDIANELAFARSSDST